jgi:pathogenesis-related protein 1
MLFKPRHAFVLLSLLLTTFAHGEDIDPGAIVAAHNSWRSEVGVAAIQWSDALQKKAELWAQQLKAENCSMKHSGPGENLYKAYPKQSATSKDANGNWIWQNSLQAVGETDVVGNWGNEKQWYGYAANSCNAPVNKSCGHYTQVVWKNSTHVGCAKAVCSDFAQIWVCNYEPVGNVRGQKPY